MARKAMCNYAFGCVVICFIFSFLLDCHVHGAGPLSPAPSADSPQMLGELCNTGGAVAGEGEEELAPRFPRLTVPRPLARGGQVWREDAPRDERGPDC